MMEVGAVLTQGTWPGRRTGSLALCLPPRSLSPGRGELWISKPLCSLPCAAGHPSGPADCPRARSLGFARTGTWEDHQVRYFLADGDLVVVETDDDHYLGTAEVRGGQLIVRNGFVGRPVLLDLADVQCVIPASEHPLVRED